MKKIEFEAYYEYYEAQVELLEQLENQLKRHETIPELIKTTDELEVAMLDEYFRIKASVKNCKNAFEAYYGHH